MPNDLLKFPVRWILFKSSVQFCLVPAQPVIQPWVAGHRARDEISAIELAQVSCRQPELLEWPTARVYVLQVLQPKPDRAIVFIDLKNSRRTQCAREIDEKPRAVRQDLTGAARYLTALVDGRLTNDLDDAGPRNHLLFIE